MPVVVKRNETAFTGPKYNFTVNGNGLAARVFHSSTPDMSGHINFNVSGRGSKTRSAEIVEAVKSFLVAEADIDLDEFLNMPESPVPVTPFQSEIDAAMTALKAGDYHGAAVIRNALFQLWIDCIPDVTPALDELDLLAADVLNVTIVIRQDWEAWLAAGPSNDRRQTLTPVLTVSPDETTVYTVPVGYSAAVDSETAWYRSRVVMADAFADRLDESGASYCRRYMAQAAESLARMQQWAANPAGYDFSDLEGAVV